VALDVGHTIEKPGATSARGESEFSFNRNLARKIQQSLTATGFVTELINENGLIKDLTTRTDEAAKADFFLSIHHDSMQPQYLSTWHVDGKPQWFGDRFSGFSLFVSRKNGHLTASLKCATAIGRQLIQQGFKPSRHHAEPIPGENRPFADKDNGVHFYDDLLVLKTARQPAVLLEAGIIVNRADELTLLDPMTQDRMAKAITRATSFCLGNSS